MLQLHRGDEPAHSFIPDFTNPIGLLIHCHSKIEGQLKNLDTAARLLRGGGAFDISTAVRAVVLAKSHFAGPGTLHTADEEVSLFPRIVARATSSDRDVVDAIDKLRREHQIIDRAHARFDRLFERMQGEIHWTKSDLEEFDTKVAVLLALYWPHMDIENDYVFPAALRLLSEDELLEVGREMSARRFGK